MEQQQAISLLVCGDEGVGKTSIINALISRSFENDSSDLSLAGNLSANSEWSEVTLPAALNKYDGIEIDLRIVDTRTEGAVIEHLPSADAVILVYDITNEDTFERAISFWLELIQRHACSDRTNTAATTNHAQNNTSSSNSNSTNKSTNNSTTSNTTTNSSNNTSNTNSNESNSSISSTSNSSISFSTASSSSSSTSSSPQQIPVILVGNKLDRRGGGRMALSEEHHRKTNAVMSVPCVEAFLYCSAARLLLIREVFYYAQKAVVYPVAPLYNNNDAVLTEQFQVALWRIFRIFDVDRDGYLSDDELALFQSHCFGAQLRRSDISAIKKVVKNQSSENVMYGNRRDEFNNNERSIQNGRTNDNDDDGDDNDNNNNTTENQNNNGSVRNNFNNSNNYPIISSIVNSVGLLNNDGTAGVVDGKVTFAGFVCLNQIFIDRNRPESPWLVLRRFGYECIKGKDVLSMRLDRDLLPTTNETNGTNNYDQNNNNNNNNNNTLTTEEQQYDPNENKIPSLNHILNDQAFELSISAIQFLNELFTQFATTTNIYSSSTPSSSTPSSTLSSSSSSSSTVSFSILGKHQLALLFHICPNGKAPWEISDLMKHMQPMSLERSGWLAMWSLVVHFDPHTVMRYMWYLGYLGDSIKSGESVREMHLHWPYNRLHVERAIRVTRSRKKEKWKKRLDRKTVRCWVIGHEDSGKEHLFNIISEIKTGGDHEDWNGNASEKDNLQEKKNARDGSNKNENDVAAVFSSRHAAAGFSTSDSRSELNSNSNGNELNTFTKDDLSAVLWYPKLKEKQIKQMKQMNIQKKQQDKEKEEQPTNTDNSNNDATNTSASSASTASSTTPAIDATPAIPSSSSSSSTSLSRAWVRSIERSLILTTFSNDIEFNECDIAVLVFDPTNLTTLEYLKMQQAKLPGHIPCRYVAIEKGLRETTTRLVTNNTSNNTATNSSAQATSEPTTATATTDAASSAPRLSSSEMKTKKATVYAAAKEWCISLELEEPVKLSMSNPHTLDATNVFFESVLRNGLEPSECRPVSEESMWEKQKQFYWFWGGSITLGVGIVGVAAWLFLNSRKGSDGRGESGLEVRKIK